METTNSREKNPSIRILAAPLSRAPQAQRPSGESTWRGTAVCASSQFNHIPFLLICISKWVHCLLRICFFGGHGSWLHEPLADLASLVPLLLGTLSCLQQQAPRFLSRQGSHLRSDQRYLHLFFSLMHGPWQFSLALYLLEESSLLKLEVRHINPKASLFGICPSTSCPVSYLFRVQFAIIPQSRALNPWCSSTLTTDATRSINQYESTLVMGTQLAIIKLVHVLHGGCMCLSLTDNVNAFSSTSFCLSTLAMLHLQLQVAL